MNNIGPIVTRDDKERSMSKTRKLAEKVVSKRTVASNMHIISYRPTVVTVCYRNA